MAEIYSYEAMIVACGECKSILEKMTVAIDNFDSATTVYSANIQDKISAAAEKLVEELRDIIDRTKATIDEMNDTMGGAGEELAENEEQGESEVDEI